jgi:hypothetical protein
MTRKAIEQSGISLSQKRTCLPQNRCDLSRTYRSILTFSTVHSLTQTSYESYVNQSSQYFDELFFIKYENTSSSTRENINSNNNHNKERRKRDKL